MICYFKGLCACATRRATINVPPDQCYERVLTQTFWVLHCLSQVSEYMCTIATLPLVTASLILGRHLAIVSQLSGESATAESAPSAIGPITLHTKQAGKRSAGNPHAAFDAARAGNVAMVELCTHPAIERAGLETLHLQQARLPSTLPAQGGAG